MRRLTLSEVNEYLKTPGCKIIETSGSVSKTREGVYIKIQTGLSSNTFFIGLARDKGIIVIEDI